MKANTQYAFEPADFCMHQYDTADLRMLQMRTYLLKKEEEQMT